MNTRLKNALMVLALAALGLGPIAGCSKSSEEPGADETEGGEATEPAGEPMEPGAGTEGGEEPMPEPETEPPPPSY